MNKIIELREKRAKLWESTKAFLDSRRNENGLLSVEDTASYERMEQDVVNLGKEIERLERQAVMDLELSKATSSPLFSTPNNTMDEEKKGRGSDNYKKAFWNQMRNNSTQEIRNSLKIGTDSEGGYLVPDEFERTLVEGLLEENIFRKLATIINTSSGDRKIPVVASKGTASWVDEEAPISEFDDSLGQISIGAYKLYVSSNCGQFFYFSCFDFATLVFEVSYLVSTPYYIFYHAVVVLILLSFYYFFNFYL